MALPKLRFKEFGGDWKLENLGDSFSLISGYAFPSTSSVESGAKWLKIADVGIQEMTPNNPSYLPLGYLDKYSQFIVNKNDYVIALTRPILNKKLKIAQVGNLYDGALLNQRVAKIHSKNNNLDFIYSLLQRSKTVEELENSIAGTDPPNLSLNDVKEIKLAFPSKEEQTKIASFLFAVDEKIKQLTQKHELLIQYKQGMMQKLFSQQIRFKADDGSEFGEWEDKSLNEIASKQSNKNKDDLITEVLTNSATQGIIKQSDYFDREIVTESNLNGYYIVNLNDFVYNPRISVHAPVGPIKRNKKCLGVMSPLYTVFTVKEGNLTYLEYFFDSNFWHDYVKSVANSGARHDRMNIINKDFFDMPILYPCLEEQTKIANFLSAIDQKIEVVAQQIEQAKQWKKGLLQQMFV
ncbi:restriction endonuclease subunit S [Acinetobacter baumannii]|nr:restriction endonuclease subunit S [Acinetobacter baumannii]HEM7759488.1 restriction endonuclease subunit S [Acinetobacter baumannii]